MKLKKPGMRGDEQIVALQELGKSRLEQKVAAVSLLITRFAAILFFAQNEQTVRIFLMFAGGVSAMICLAAVTMRWPLQADWAVTC